MSDRFRSSQGSVTPTMFIGLGGVGSRIVDRIARHAHRLPNWPTQLEPLTSFVSVDTNELDQHKLVRIPPGNRINIAAFDKARAIDGYRRSKDAQALHWLDPGYQPRSGFKPGAGQIRLEARLAFFYNSSHIKGRLKQVVDETLRPGVTWRQAEPPKYNVYVFCSLAGGTGSGSFLPMAYLIQRVIRDINWQPRVIGNFLLSTLLLEKVGQELHSDIHANTYAALKEMEYLTKLDYPQIKRERQGPESFAYLHDDDSDEVPVVSTRPYFIGFILDKPAHLSLRSPVHAIADAAFLQIFTPIIDNLASELDNYEKNLEELTRFPGDLRNVGQGYTKNFGAFGAAALVLPGEELLEYCAFRFAAHAMRSQITFGVDRSDPSDERARALAKLAVDYSDPKFLRMGDDAREEVIHRSFMESVRELARQDAKEELFDGFWFQLVESVDRGKVTGKDEKGEPHRSESLLEGVHRRFGESAKQLNNQISIKDRAFVFHKEGLNQYVELVSRLIEDIRAARLTVDEGLRGLEAEAAEGEAVSQLKLDPIKERYLALRLLELCDREWLPAAQTALEKARVHDVSNPKVRERLEKELFQSLQEAAAQRRIFNRDQAFMQARDEAQAYYRRVAAAARKLFEAEIRLGQLRAFRGYLLDRARQYARLATRMDRLVVDLEREAERVRSGEVGGESTLALRVEIFETLEEPRRRLWDEVYQNLFIERGRSLSTFDRNQLAETISQQLKPEIREDGKVVAKGTERTVQDLRRALTDLGRRRLTPAILGDDESPGLDLARGLELEAELVLSAGNLSRAPTAQQMEDYAKQKFLALSQICGVMARVDSVGSQSLQDGVVVNRTRQLVIGCKDPDKDSFRNLTDRLTAVLQVGGRQVKADTWADPRLAIVHDVELPIPLYYFQPVVNEIESAYLTQEANERRAFHLHIDYRWEKSLPNLNPRRSEVSVSWALKALAEGLISGVIRLESGSWVWLSTDDKPYLLGDNLSSALYEVSELHQNEDIRKTLKPGEAPSGEEVKDEGPAEKAKDLAGEFRSVLAAMARSERRGEMTRNDVLDRPVLRALTAELERLSEASGADRAKAWHEGRFGS